ncbi:MAG: hypothetical protein LQ351_000414 [Letrouitia transgressa]|nr:MAG: hypothetical protein LQ351_000414 [Letrouitia transgressa]
MVAAHTDSPALRIKPVSKKQSDGFIQVGVETYGGGLWHTWFDRDLGIAGRVMIRNATGGYEQKLVKINRPILRIPTLAIHLDRQETFSFNKETQLFPIAGLVAAELNRTGGEDDPVAREVPATSTLSPDSDSFASLKAANERHHPHVVDLIAKEAGVDPSNVIDFEMLLFDTQKACIGGLNEELIFSARLDNLGMSFCSIMGLINSLASPSALEDEHSIRLVALFDHEEIGSTTAQGADSNLLPAIVRRLSFIGSSNNKDTAYEQTLSTSFLISADMAHSVNPNYSGKYEPDHKTEMNKGTVIKINANSRYVTNSPGIVLLQEVAQRQKVPLQLFVVRNDSSCGGTIGPMLAAALGARTIDVGNPQLSMHSIRETGGVYDVEYAIRLFEGFFMHFGQLEGNILVD